MKNWWLKFLEMKHPERRRELLVEAVREFLPGNFSMWVPQNVANDLLRLENSISILRRFNSALQAYPTYYHRSPEPAGDLSPEFLAFIESEKAEQIHAAEERRIMQERLVQWLTQPERDMPGARQLAAVPVVTQRLWTGRSNKFEKALSRRALHASPS